MFQAWLRGLVTMRGTRVYSLLPVCRTRGWAPRVMLEHVSRSPSASGAVAESGGIPRKGTSQLGKERCIGAEGRAGTKVWRQGQLEALEGVTSLGCRPGNRGCLYWRWSSFLPGPESKSHLGGPLLISYLDGGSRRRTVGPGQRV